MMPSKSLFDDDSDEADTPQQNGLHINSTYATNYNQWRKKEELQKLKDRYGDVDEADESTSESESEEEWTADHEKQFLLTLSALKAKDESVFDKNKRFFNVATPDEADASKPSTSKKDAMYLKDYERKVITERHGKFSSSSEDDDSDDERLRKTTAAAGSVVDEARKLKESIKSAVAAVESDEADDDGELLTKRQKTQEEQKREDDEYLSWLADRDDGVDVDAAQQQQLAGLKQYWSDPSLEDGEKFLRDFILNRKYEDRKDGDVGIPSYDDVVNFTPELEDDEDELDKQAVFEHKYNFRYEEPDQAFVSTQRRKIKQYPRTIKDSVRREDTKRKEQRDAHKERKLKEKQQRRDEISRLKALKRAEINDKLEKLRHATGDETIAFDAVDLEKDFDPAEYDAKMQQLFTDDYYGAGDADEEKPVFSDLSDDEVHMGDWDTWEAQPSSSKSQDDSTAAVEDTKGTEDAASQSASSTSRSRDTAAVMGIGRKRKRRSKLAAALQNKKPTFDPNEKTFQQYFDEYYQLDCEDIVAGQPVRFKYRSVPANDFGLSTDEVLVAEDRELNAWASLNKMSQYRPNNEEQYDVVSWRRKAANVNKKQRLLPSVFKPVAEKEDVDADGVDGESKTAGAADGGDAEKKKGRRRKKKKRGTTNAAGTTEGEAEKTVAPKIEAPATADVSADSPSKSPKIKLEIKAEPPSTPASMASSSPVKHQEESTNPQEKKKSRRQRSRQHNRRGGHEAKKANSEKTANEKQGALTDERLRSYGMNPKKFRNKMKYGQGQKQEAQ